MCGTCQDGEDGHGGVCEDVCVLVFDLTTHCTASHKTSLTSFRGKGLMVQSCGGSTLLVIVLLVVVVEMIVFVAGRRQSNNKARTTLRQPMVNMAGNSSGQ